MGLNTGLANPKKLIYAIIKDLSMPKGYILKMRARMGAKHIGRQHNK